MPNTSNSPGFFFNWIQYSETTRAATFLIVTTGYVIGVMVVGIALQMKLVLDKVQWKNLYRKYEVIARYRFGNYFFHLFTIIIADETIVKTRIDFVIWFFFYVLFSQLGAGIYAMNLQLK